MTGPLILFLLAAAFDPQAASTTTNSSPTAATIAAPTSLEPTAVETIPTTDLGPQPVPNTAPVAVPVLLNPTIPDTPAARRRAEVLAKDMVDLAAMIGGRWDSDGQSFFEPELGIAADQRRPRVHALVRPLPEAIFGKPAFFVEHRAGSETGSVLRQRVWTLRVDPSRDGIEMAVLAPGPDVNLAEIWTRENGFTDLAAAGFSEVGGCDVLWRRRGGGFSGETRPGGCRVTSTTGAGSVTLSERHDLSSTVWDVRDLGVDGTGQRVFGAEDGRPARFDRAISYTCWAGRVADGAPPVATGLTIHDRGGEVRIGDLNNGGYRIRLRTVEWPFGNNRPSLTLYLFTAPGEQAEAFAWGDPGTNRLAINLRAMQASCTRSTETLWN